MVAVKQTIAGEHQTRIKPLRGSAVFAGIVEDVERAGLAQDTRIS
jgi:hypothetical protein